MKNRGENVISELAESLGIKGFEFPKVDTICGRCI